MEPHDEPDPHGYYGWWPPEADIMPAVSETGLDPANGFGISLDGSANCWPGYYLLPTLDSLTRGKTYLEVFPRGASAAPGTVLSEQPQLVIREDNRSAYLRRTAVTGAKPGGHVFKLFMQDPTIVVQSIIMHTADLQKSCFGPPAVKPVGPS